MTFEVPSEVTEQQDSTFTPLMLASLQGKTNDVLALIPHQEDINTQCPRGWSAVMYASYGGSEEIVDALINAKANVNIKGKDGASAIELALKRQDTGIIDSILRGDLDFDALDGPVARFLGKFGETFDKYLPKY